jgi:hypothetical protein
MPRIRPKCCPADDRGQSPLVGVVLIIGFVALVGVSVVLVGSLALDDLRGQVSIENAENSMREVDARLSEVSFGGNEVRTLDVGSDSVRVRNDSKMIVTVNETAACSVTIPMGSLEQDAGDRVVAYEGGGVWKTAENGSVMVSPPSFQYKNGTVNFPVVGVNGSVGENANQLRATQNRTESLQRSRNITKTLSKDVCSPPENVSITVHSDYYDAWGRYLEDEVSTNATVDDANETATIRIERIGDSTTAQINQTNITASTDYVAEIKVNGTAYHAAGWHLPFAFQVDVEGESPKTFAPDYGDPTGGRIVDRPVNMANGQDDINNPLVSYETGHYPTDTIAVEKGKSFSIKAISYVCNDDGNSAITRDESYLVDLDYPNDGSVSGGYDDRCVAPDLQDRELRNLSSSADSDLLWAFNYTNNHVTSSETGITRSEFKSGSANQRTVDKILGPIYNETGGEIYLDLKPNQAVYVYELNENPSTGDFNDAIVLVTVYQQGAINPGGNFLLKIRFDSIEISTS